MESNEYPTVIIPDFGGIHSGDKVRHSDRVGTARRSEVHNLHKAGISDAGELANALNWFAAQA